MQKLLREPLLHLLVLGALIFAWYGRRNRDAPSDVALGGNLVRPTVTLDPTGAAVTGGAAVATGGLSLLGKSLFDRFLRERDPCGKVVSELRKMHEEGAARP